MRITVKLWAEKSKKCFGIRFEALIASAGRRHNKKINTVNQKSIIMSTIKVSPRPFERTFSSLFEDLFQHLPAQEWGQRLATDTVPVNIRETKDGYVLDVVAPGFEKQDFKISMEGELLTLSAERKQESKTAEERFLKREFSFKSFSRSFRMDDQIDRSAITAKYEQGILQLTLPKKEEVKLVPKEINVL
jgi:HSP20 family protein